MASDIECDFSDNEYEYPEKEPSQTWIYQMNPDWYKPLHVKNICVRKVLNESKKYKKCKKKLFKCSWCYEYICPNKECIPQYMIRKWSSVSPSKKHEKCLECDNITCCPSGICKDCENLHTYDMITDKVAIGSYQASYKSFDLVINLDYPENGVKCGEVVCMTEGDTYVIKCGYEDVNGGLTSDKLDDLLNRIDEFKKGKEEEPKILFHCYAGVSRSATVAIAYLAKNENKTTKEIYKLAKEKRPRINPNKSFREMIYI